MSPRLVDTQSVRALFRVHGLPWPAQFARWARRRGLTPAGETRIHGSRVSLWTLDDIEALLRDQGAAALLAD